MNTNTSISINLIEWLLALSVDLLRSATPFDSFKKTAHGYYFFVKEEAKNTYNGIFPLYSEFMNNVIDDLANKRCSSYPRIFKSCMDLYTCKQLETPSEEYRAAAAADAEKYTSNRDKLKAATAETRKILDKSVPLFNTTENKQVLDYIKYVKNYEPEQDAALLYSSLFNMGFMQGIRAERARRNGTPISTKERTSVAAYTGRKHERRYSRPAKEQKLISMFEKMSSVQRAAMLDLITAIESNKFSLDDTDKAQAFFDERLETYKKNGVQFCLTS